MAISDILTTSESVPAARPKSSRDAGFTRHETSNSGYRDRLARSLNAAESSTVHPDRVQPDDAPLTADSSRPNAERPNAESGNRPSPLSVPLDGTGSAPAEPPEVLTTVPDVIQTSSAAVECQVSQNCKPLELPTDEELNAAEFVLVTFEPIDSADVDDAATSDIPVELQSVAGLPPAQLQVLTVSTTTLTKSPGDVAVEKLTPPAGLTFSIDTVQVTSDGAPETIGEAKVPNLQPTVPAGFQEAIERRASLPIVKQTPSTPETHSRQIPGVDVSPSLPDDATVSVVEPVDVAASNESAPIANEAEPRQEMLSLPASRFTSVKWPADTGVSTNLAASPTTEATSTAEVEPQADIQLVSPTVPTRQGPANDEVIDASGHSTPTVSRQSSEVPGMRTANAPAAGIDVPPATEIADPAAQLTEVEQTSEATHRTTSESSLSEAVPKVQSETSVAATDSKEPGNQAEIKAKEFVDRIANSLRAAHDSGRHLRMRLNPPELGVLQVEVVSRGGTVSARLEVQTSTAHQAIVDNLPLLHEALTQRGTTIDRIDVIWTRNSNDDAGTPNGGGQSQQFEQQSSQRRDQPHRQPESKNPQAENRHAVTSHNTQLDQLDIQI
jgi:flagellar hook-length control protein FliK